MDKCDGGGDDDGDDGDEGDEGERKREGKGDEK